ncbi:hypothetical protein ColLi_13393 [Colletotrichum liriopes]|uniref:Helicase ATP-binding domain-containing protein n=1 Tax=Colletotrichum liriopes TaxID=708192 RepID=A0AA37H1G2_9PEZI|nr:hypothetical protein ColLi_13393 [Colletotrichum liriopes]
MRRNPGSGRRTYGPQAVATNGVAEHLPTHLPPRAVTGRREGERVASIVFVSAEHSQFAEFLSYAEGLRARRVLKRIFVDECHTILLDGGYRPRLLELKGLYRFGVLMILLTATLPVRMEAWFRRLTLAEDASILQASTARLNN